MPTSFTTTQVGASSNYFKYLTGKLEKSHRKNEPRLLDFSLSPTDGSFVKLNRGSYITVNSTKYSKWFTGYITNEPELKYLGTVGGVGKWGYTYEATSDEIILNIKPLGILPPFINRTQGEILKSLIEMLAPGIFDTTNIDDGLLLARYVVQPDKNFLTVVKEFCDTSAFSFYAHDKKAYFTPQDTLAGGFELDGSNKHFTPSQLEVKPNSLPIINDCIVLGDLEPQDYLTEVFVGDGLSARFPLVSSVWGSDRAVFLDEDFGSNGFDSSKWTVYDDAAAYLQISNGYLNCLGGLGTGSYDVHVDSAQLIPLEGTLRLTHGEWDLLSMTSGRKGLIAGLWTGLPDYSRTGCIYGIEVNSDGTTSTLQPVVKGVLDTGHTVSVDNSKRYLIRTIMNATDLFRTEQVYAYLDETGTRVEQGGTNLPTTASFHTTIVEVDPTDGTVKNTYTWDHTGQTLDDTQTFALYVPMASNDLHATVTGITISTPVTATLEIKASGDTVYEAKPLGPNEMDTLDGQSAVATISDSNNGAATKSSILGTPQYNPGQAALTFFKDTSRQVSTTPQPGDVLRVRYRRAGAAMGRVQDTSSIESESTSWGDNGLRSIVRKDISPQPRTSAECEMVAGVIVGESSFQHFEGSYTQWSDYFTSEPMAGAVMTFANLPSDLPATLQAEEIQEVHTTFECDKPTERFQHKITFGGSNRLARLLRGYNKQTDVFTPQDTAEIPDFVDINAVGSAFAPDVVAPVVTAWDADTFTINTGQDAPAGGGFEVRLSDASWGADDGKNLVSRTSSRVVTLPRNNRNKVAFIRAYDARNKCLYSEDLTNGAWTKTSCSVANSIGVNHVGKLATISDLTFSGAGSVKQEMAVTAGTKTVTGTIDLKGTGTVVIALSESTSTTGETTQSVTLTGGWKRVSVTRTYPGGGGNIVFSVRSSGAISISASRASVELSSVETVYCKTNATAYGALSRYPSGVRISFPFVPPEVQNLSGVLVDASTIKLDYDLPTDDTVYDIYQVVMENQDGEQMGAFTPDYTTTHQTNLLAVPSTFTVAAGDTIYVKTYNVLGESSDLLTGFSTGTITDPNHPGVEVGNTFGTDDGMIHVREYGAVGDGVTDDTARIQAALNAAGNLTEQDNGSSNLVLTVSVPGTTMPWVTESNPSLPYGINDGRAPVVIHHALTAGQAITITATGTVQPSDSRPFVGPEGQANEVTGDTLGSTSTYFPTHYIDGATLKLAGLCGAFTDSFGVVVQAVQIGAGPITLTVPAGATLLQLGINDDHFSDNIGSFIATVTIIGQASGTGLASKNRKIVFIPSDMTCGVGGSTPVLSADKTGPYDGLKESSSYWDETTQTLIWVKDTVDGVDPAGITFNKLVAGTLTTFTSSVPGHFNGGPDPGTMLSDGSNIFIAVNNGYGSGEWHKLSMTGTYLKTWGACFTLGGTDFCGGGSLGKIGAQNALAFNYGFGSRIGLIKTTDTTSGGFGPSVNSSTALWNYADTGQGPLVWDTAGNTWVATGSGDIKKIDWSTNPGTITTYSSMYSGSPQALLHVANDSTLLIVTSSGVYKFSLGTHTIENSISKTFAGVGNVASNNVFACGVDLVNALTLAITQDQNEADFGLPNPITDYTFGRPYDPDTNTIYVMDTAEDVYALTTSADIGLTLSIPSNVDFLIDGTLKLLPFITGGYIVGSVNTSNVRVRGRGTINSNDSTYHSVRTGGGLYFKNVTNLRVQDLALAGANKQASIYLENVNRGWFHDLYIDGTVRTLSQPGLHINGGNNLIVDSNMIRNCPIGIEHTSLTLSTIQDNIISNCTTEFSPDTFDDTVVVNSQIANGSADRRYVEWVAVNSTVLGEPTIADTPSEWSDPPVVIPPETDTTWDAETGHNTSAANPYNKVNYPDNFTGTTWTDNSGTTASVDSTKEDDSNNPITPGHVSNIDVHTLLPGNTSLPWYVHITPWFGKSGHVDIGIDCNTTQWVQDFVEDAVRRGFNGVSIDWYGHTSFENEVTLKIQSYLQTRTGNTFGYMICFDKGISGLNQSVLTSEINYCMSQYFDDPNYIRVGGKPVLQFFGVASVIGDSGMAAVKAATTGTNGFWQLGGSLLGQSYADGAYDWAHPFHNGVDGGDPYNTGAIGDYFSTIAGHSSKPCFVAPCAGFNGYLTGKVGWSKGKYLPRGDGACWLETSDYINTNLTSQVVGVMVPTWNDWEEGSQIETGIENYITVTAAMASPPTFTWSASGGTGDESTIQDYVIWATADGDNLIYIDTVATGVGTYDMSTATGLTVGTSYTLYVEAIGKPCIRCHMSNGVTYTP